MIDNEVLPTFSIIVASPSMGSCETALQALKKLDYPLSHFEVILSLGQSPSQQRNAGAAPAKHQWLYFIDDDSQLHPEALRKAATIVEDFDADVIGGPILLADGASVLQRAIHRVFQSRFYSGAVSSRYKSTGEPRKSDESEMILSNLLVNAKWFRSSTGFDGRLYPNEENEFLQRYSSLRRCYYHPQLFARRLPRATFFSFCRQFFSYGSGRMNNILLTGNVWKNLIYSLPSFAVVSAVFSLAGGLLGNMSQLLLSAYTIFMLLGCFQIGIKSRRLPALEFFLAWTMHFCYGLGFILEVFRPSRWLPFSSYRGPTPVVRFYEI